MSGHIGQRIDAQRVARKITIPQHVAHPHTHVEGALAFGGNTLTTSGVPPLSTARQRPVHRGRRVAARTLGALPRRPGARERQLPVARAVHGGRRRPARTRRRTRPEPARPGRRAARARGRRRAVKVAVRGAPGRLPDISARSDLTGVALNFPAPFAKAAGTPMPFSFTLQPAPQDGKRLEHADLTLGPVSATCSTRRAASRCARCAARWAFTGCPTCRRTA